jgi:hypothetical protein
MYYDNPSCNNQENIAGTWNSNYVGVWHLNEDSGTTICDSTSNSLDGTANDKITLDQTGMAGKCVDVDPSTGSIDSDANLPATYSSWTVEGWLQLDSTPGWGNMWAPSVGERFPSQIWDSGTFGCWNSGELQTTSTFPEDGSTWTYVTSKCDGVNTFVYWNGLQENSNTQHNTISDSWSIGDETANGEEIDGRVDEIRVSKVAHSSDWIKTTYNTIQYSDLFLTIAGEETY